MTGKTPGEHLKNLERVMSRLLEEGVTAKCSKCFFVKEIV